MKIQVMEIKKEDMREDITHLLCDDGTLITVIGFGTGEYRWKVENADQRGNADYDPAATLEGPCGPRGEDGMWDASFLGQALVWAAHYTFAHVVLDLIHNQ